jgi:hypothetical protein
MVSENSVMVVLNVATRICVDDGRREVSHLVEKGMASMFGDLVRRHDAEALVNEVVAIHGSKSRGKSTRRSMLATVANGWWLGWRDGSPRVYGHRARR